MHEANLGIPVVSLVDTSDQGVDIHPHNDDAIRAIKLLVGRSPMVLKVQRHAKKKMNWKNAVMEGAPSAEAAAVRV